MLDNDKIIDIAKRIDVTKKRWNHVLAIRNHALTEIEKIQQEIKHHLFKMIENEYYPKEINEIHEFLRKNAITLQEDTATVIRSYEISLKIIRHPRHMPLVLKYFEEVPDQYKEMFKTSIEELSHYYNLIEQRIEKDILVSMNNQLSFLQSFLKSNDIATIFGYMMHYKHYKSILSHINSELHPAVGKVKKMMKVGKTVIKKAEFYTEDHKRMSGLIFIGVSLLGIAIDSMCPASRILQRLLKIAHTFHKLGHYGVEAEHYFHATAGILAH